MEEHEILIPVESFVTVLAEKEQSENLEMGYNAIWYTKCKCSKGVSLDFVYQPGKDKSR